MNKIITAGCVAVAAFAAIAMPSKEELVDARRIVEDVTKADLAAFKAGKKSAKDVAKAHISHAEKAENQAEKYLLYQGAFKLYARCEEYDLAADALQAMNREVKDVPPEVIAELICDELRYVPDAKAQQLVAMLKEAKHPTSAVAKNRTTIQSIIDGMIKVPGRDYWLSETELTQGQWEAVMGYNLSGHKGANLPVECVSRDDCDVFLEKLNQAKEVRASQFEFALPSMEEWRIAVSAGGSGNDIWIKPGVAGNILDMAWVGENSSTQTHVVATKSANAFGLYDMMGNVWEWVSNDAESRGTRRGGSAFRLVAEWPMSRWIYTPRGRRYDDCGLRVAAHIRANKVLNAEKPRLGGRLLTRRQEEKKIEQQQATVDGYTWSYRVKNGEAEIVSEKDGKRSCAVSPNPKGHLAIPATFEGVKVTGIGEHAFFGCGELNSVMIPAGVKNICNGAFYYCSGLTSISISSSVTDIVPTAFVALHSVKSFSVAPDNPFYSSRNGLLCSKDGSVLVAGVNGDVTIPAGVKTIGRQAFLGRGLNMTVTIPSSVTKIEERAFAYCLGLTSVTMCGEKPGSGKDVFRGCDKLKSIHVPANAKSWAGMKEWQGKKLIFDAKVE